MFYNVFYGRLLKKKPTNAPVVYLFSLICLHLHVSVSVLYGRHTVHSPTHDILTWLFNFLTYKVVQIWPGRFVCKQVTVCPGHIWTTLYNTMILELDNILKTVFRTDTQVVTFFLSGDGRMKTETCRCKWMREKRHTTGAFFGLFFNICDRYWRVAKCSS